MSAAAWLKKVADGGRLKASRVGTAQASTAEKARHHGQRMEVEAVDDFSKIPLSCPAPRRASLSLLPSRAAQRDYREFAPAPAGKGVCKAKLNERAATSNDLVEMWGNFVNQKNPSNAA